MKKPTKQDIKDNAITFGIYAAFSAGVVASLLGIGAGAVVAATAAGATATTLVGAAALIGSSFATAVVIAAPIFGCIYALVHAEQKCLKKDWIKKERPWTKVYGCLAGFAVVSAPAVIMLSSLSTDQSQHSVPSASKTPAVSQKFQGACDGIKFDAKISTLTIQAAARPRLNLNS